MESHPQDGYETTIYSIDGKHKKVITDKWLLEKINQCHHITALYHLNKDILFEVENAFLPLKDYADSIMIDSRGGSVISVMSLLDFFTLIDIGKRIKIAKRHSEDGKEVSGIGYGCLEIEEFSRGLGS